MPTERRTQGSPDEIKGKIMENIIWMAIIALSAIAASTISPFLDRVSGKPQQTREACDPRRGPPVYPRKHRGGYSGQREETDAVFSGEPGLSPSTDAARSRRQLTPLLRSAPILGALF